MTRLKKTLIDYDFVKDGGVLIIECQAHHWVPQQKAYDLFVDCFNIGRVLVSYEDIPQPGFNVTRRNIPLNDKGVYQREKDHPILKYLSKRIYGDPSPDTINTSTNPWFKPKESIRSQWVLEQTYPSKIYSGWFTKLSRKWKPLLFDEEAKNPVMIWAAYGQGSIILSTMFIASSFIPQLIRNIFQKDFPERLRDYTRNTTQSARNIWNYAFGTLASGISLLVAEVFFGSGAIIPVPYNFAAITVITVAGGITVYMLLNRILNGRFRT